MFGLLLPKASKLHPFGFFLFRTTLSPIFTVSIPVSTHTSKYTFNSQPKIKEKVNKNGAGLIESLHHCYTEHVS